MIDNRLSTYLNTYSVSYVIHDLNTIEITHPYPTAIPSYVKLPDVIITHELMYTTHLPKIIYTPDSIYMNKNKLNLIEFAFIDGWVYIPASEPLDGVKIGGYLINSGILS